MAFRSLFARRAPEPRIARVPDGERIYAIGDIHGRLDCLDRVMAQIATDEQTRGPAETTIVFLGDLVDRGPESCGVVARSMEIAARQRCVFLMGNHEEIMLRAWEGDAQGTRLFHRIGGRETVLSYGVGESDYDNADIETLTAMIGHHVPAGHVGFIRRFVDWHAIGDYLFVHAGIRPGVPIAAQTPADMRWIRREFLEDRRDHGHVVVHGHTITKDAVNLPNRIGIDTGAYASDRLTVLGLQGADRWFLQS